MRDRFHTTIFGRLFYLLRYHQTEQLARRVLTRLKREWLSRSGKIKQYDRPAEPSLSVRNSSSLRDALRHRVASVGEPADLKRELAGEFTFLNQAIRLGNPIDWSVQNHNVDHLWRFHLHYQEFLTRPFRSDAVAPVHVLEDAWQLVQDWIDRYPITSKDALTDGWHPFCISRRLPVWICLWLVGEPKDAPKVLASMHSQAAYLADNLELDLGGNHLLENLRALVVAGGFLSNGDRFLNVAQKHLKRELPRQILEHGEHYERCPMYHAHVLDCLLEICQVARGVAPPIVAVCQPFLKPMTAFLSDISHPDGMPPQFGDTSVGDTISTESLTRRGTELHSGCVESTGPEDESQVRTLGDYWTYRNGTDFLVFDAASACADELPGHAHADLLGYELSLGARRVVTDSGVFDYQAGAMRDYCRGTGSHNVLLIDGQSQFDLWSRFRMGYRGVPTSFEYGDVGNYSWAKATHNAYRRLGVPQSGRCIVVHPARVFFVFDWAIGKGLHLLESLIHLHGDISVRPQSRDSVRLNCHDEWFSIQAIQGLRPNVRTSWACPQFGERVRRNLVCISRRSMLPGVVGYWIAPTQRHAVATIDTRMSSIEIRVQVDGDCSELSFAAF